MLKQVYDVIVIGAGISGIGASQILTQNQISHAILEGRDRVGGRIVSTQFDGIKVQLGASFVHMPNFTNNLIAKFITQNQKEVIPAHYDKAKYFYEDKTTLSQHILQKASQFYEKFQLYADKVAQNSNNKTVYEVYQEFQKLEMMEFDQTIKNLVKWEVEIYGNIEGAETKELSINQYVQHYCQTPQDYLPSTGYSSIFEQLLSKIKPTVFLSQIVTQVDYQGQLIVIKTKNENIFYCRKLISSLPLGVLQQQKVKFTPPLPNQYVKAIKSMKSGVLNKLFVSFQKPFWDQNIAWLNFVARTAKNVYPVALVLPIKQKNIICVFISGQASKQISNWSKQVIGHDFSAFISKFTHQEIKIKDLELTRWNLDEFSMGSYSYCHNRQNFDHSVDILKEPIQNKIWFIGQHMNKQVNGCVHSAFQTGIQAAEKVSLILKQLKEKS